MRLISSGCSNTAGAGLPGFDLDSSTPSPCAWPQLLADDLQMDHEIRSESGRSNYWIYNQIKDADLTDALVAVVWSYFTRYTLYDDDGQPHNISPGPIDTQRSRPFYSMFSDRHMAMMNIDIVDHCWYYLKHRNVRFAFSLSHSYIADYFLERSTIPIADRTAIVEDTFDQLKVDLGDDGMHPGINSHQLMATAMRKKLGF